MARTAKVTVIIYCAHCGGSLDETKCPHTTRSGAMTMPQTHDDIHAKIDEMMQEFPLYIHTEVDRILSTGALNLNNADNDFRLPKIVLQAVLHRLADQYAMPYPSKSDKRLARNLAHF
jgi:hypothetical protein